MKNGDIIVNPLVAHGKGINVYPSNCFKPSEPVTKYSGEYLPHWYQEGTIQFLTIHLEDSLPGHVVEKLKYKYEQIISGNYLLHEKFLDNFLKKIELLVERGTGSCILKYKSVQNIVDEVLRYYDGCRYDLYDYVIMPNHIHFLILPFENTRKIISDFKRYTTRLINENLNRKGVIWQEDYFDRIIRSLKDFSDKAEYIRNNPKNIHNV